MEEQKLLQMARSERVPPTLCSEKRREKDHHTLRTTCMQSAAWWAVTHSFQCRKVFLLTSTGKCKAQELQNKFNLHSPSEKIQTHSCGGLLKVNFWIRVEEKMRSTKKKGRGRTPARQSSASKKFPYITKFLFHFRANKTALAHARFSP